MVKSAGGSLPPYSVTPNSVGDSTSCLTTIQLRAAMSENSATPHASIATIETRRRDDGFHAVQQVGRTTIQAMSAVDLASAASAPSVPARTADATAGDRPMATTDAVQATTSGMKMASLCCPEAIGA